MRVALPKGKLTSKIVLVQYPQCTWVIGRGCSQGLPLSRPHLRDGSGCKGIFLEIPAYMRPSEGKQLLSLISGLTAIVSEQIFTCCSLMMTAKHVIVTLPIALWCSYSQIHHVRESKQNVQDVNIHMIYNITSLGYKWYWLAIISVYSEIKAISSPMLLFFVFIHLPYDYLSVLSLMSGIITNRKFNGLQIEAKGFSVEPLKINSRWIWPIIFTDSSFDFLPALSFHWVSLIENISVF